MPGYGRVTVWPELPGVAVFFLGSAPGLVTARQDWSERMVPNASGDACVERAIKRGEARGTARQRRCGWLLCARAGETVVLVRYLTPVACLLGEEGCSAVSTLPLN